MGKTAKHNKRRQLRTKQKIRENNVQRNALRTGRHKRTKEGYEVAPGFRPQTVKKARKHAKDNPGLVGKVLKSFGFRKAVKEKTKKAPREL